MIDLKGRRYVVFGVATSASICWGIVKQILACGGEVILVSHPDLKKFVEKLAAEAGISAVYFADVANEESVEMCFSELARHQPLDGVVHGIAFSAKEELKGAFIDVSLKNFLTTMHISCFSFIEIARRCASLMQSGGSIITITFDASRGTYPHYNVMALAKAALETSVMYLASDLGEKNIRVNGIAASPENTLSARGISNFYAIGAFAEAMSPLQRRATVSEISNEAVYLLSSASSGVTGQIRFVDCGASITTMPPGRNAGMLEKAMGNIREIYERIAQAANPGKQE